MGWVDDAVVAVRASVHDLDALQCGSLKASELAQATLQLVTQISSKDFDKNKIDPHTLASAPGQKSPCQSAGAKHSEKVVKFSGGSAADFNQSACVFADLTLPGQFDVLAAQAYSGRTIGYQIDQSGHEGTRIDVAVNHPGKPVVLMLGSYEPTIWNIGWTRDTNIVAVMASGYHRQIVAGLKGNVPTLVSTYDNQARCGYFYASSSRPRNIGAISNRFFKQGVEQLRTAQGGKVLVGEPISAGTELVTSSSAAPESLYANAPLAGKPGLEDAVKKGQLRKATQADLDAWSKASGGQANGLAVAGLRPDLGNAYVVLKRFSYPAGLYGAHMAVFFVLKGVPRPRGNPGHSIVYDFNTMACEGGLCGYRARRAPGYGARIRQ